MMSNTGIELIHTEKREPSGEVKRDGDFLVIQCLPEYAARIRTTMSAVHVKDTHRDPVMYEEDTPEQTNKIDYALRAYLLTAFAQSVPALLQNFCTTALTSNAFLKSSYEQL
ncbi:MAG: hypothetical protein LUC22_02945 [Prevotella sp.]|nr:hypothetical protein [Prevotella sp.]